MKKLKRWIKLSFGWADLKWHDGNGQLSCGLPHLVALGIFGALTKLKSAANDLPYTSQVALGLFKQCNAQASKVTHWCACALCHSSHWFIHNLLGEKSTTEMKQYLKCMWVGQKIFYFILFVLLLYGKWIKTTKRGFVCLFVLNILLCSAQHWFRRQCMQ